MMRRPVAAVKNGHSFLGYHRAMPKVSEEHREARREQITAAMLRCVATEGFHRTTMAAVIAESGLSAGAVYHYFKNKQDLIRAIAETAVGGIARVVEEAAVAEDLDTPDRVIAGVARRIGELGEELGVELHKVALQTWAEAARDPSILEVNRVEAERIKRAWLDYTRRAIDAGFLSPEARPEHAARALMGMLPGYLLQQLIFGDLTPEQYAAGVADLLR